MRHKILSVTPHPSDAVNALVTGYVERVNHYSPCALVNYKTKKKYEDRERQIQAESAWLFENIAADDVVLLLDETGKDYTSPGLASLIQKLQNTGAKQSISIVGGAFGVGADIKKRANYTITLSAFTLPHQLARLIWVEQLYRAYTILRNEKYHHT